MRPTLEKVLTTLSELLLMLAEETGYTTDELLRQFRTSTQTPNRKPYRVEAIFDLSPDIFCIHHKDGQLVWCNRAYRDLTGLTGDSVFTTPTFTFIHPDDQQLTVDASRENLVNGEGVLRHFKNRLRRYDGEYVVVAWMSVAGEDEYVYSIARDVTVLDQVEQQLVTQEERYRQLFESNPLPLAVIDSQNYRVLAANDAILVQYGYSREEFLALTMFDFHVQEDITAITPKLEDVPRGLLNSIPVRHRKKDGTIFAVDVTKHDITFEGRNAWIVFAHDATDRIAAERERLQVQTLELKLAKEQELKTHKERFVSTLSHEFRTPLTIAHTLVENLSRYHERMSPERIEEKLAQVNEQLDSMMGIMEGILMLYRTDAQRKNFKREPIQLPDLCQQIIANVEIYDQKSHRFVQEFKDLEDRVMLDRQIVEHIITNLLTNAVKYSPAKTQITLALTQQTNSLVIEVRDEGIGIPEADQAKLFEPFYRATNVGDIGGTGLGLAIVKEYVEVHRGTISVNSTVGVGTTFIVRLPV